MAPFDDWNNLDDELEEDLADSSEYFQGRDVLLFCLDASESMVTPIKSEDSDKEAKSPLQKVLEIAIELQKRKVITSPNDLVGIMLYNTAERSETKKGAEIKKHCYVYQPIGQVNAESIQRLAASMSEVAEDPNKLAELFPPNKGAGVPVGDVFTSCNWVIRDGAPKTGLKRIFLVTNEDDPHPGSTQLIRTAQTTFEDLSASGVIVTPFFVSSENKPFDRSKFWDNVIPREDTDEENNAEQMPDIITELDSLVQEMRIREIPKRSLFSIPFQLAEGFTIGVKGYGLITEQRKPTYKYFTNDRTMEEAKSKTIYYDPEYQKEYDKNQILYGMTVGAMGEEPVEGEEEVAKSTGVKNRVFFTADDVKSFRTLDLPPGLRLLGFKDRTELAFEDNIKHSTFIYPDEVAYSGSIRTFSALLKSMVKKDKIGLVLGITRRNSAPMFYALLPQEKLDEDGAQVDPPGFHLQPLPYADDIRAAPIEEAARAGEKLVHTARAWIDKLTMKNGSYQPDSYPNPALALFWGQLEAKAFQKEYDSDSFNDLSAPRYDPIHKRAGALLESWKEELNKDEAADHVMTTAATTKGTKRKAEIDVDEAEIRSRSESGTLEKVRSSLLSGQDFLKSKGLTVSGKKSDLVERIEDYLRDH
ncbi:hypothetical protein M422DRAFT_158695 [Sphaerobolus stellatus SS14]|nr:hypothetical protein M422DRAFT_158695 [Sphaerobolus stellatus SS14]